VTLGLGKENGPGSLTEKKYYQPNDTCSGGSCAGTPKDCDDSDPCTTSDCDEATGDCLPPVPIVCPPDQCCDDGECIPGDCPPDPCPSVSAGDPIEPNPSPENLKKHVCAEEENPDGSDDWTAAQWASYLGLSVSPSDVDEQLDSVYVLEDDCSCLLIFDPPDPYDVDGGPLEVTWSGGPVDVTQIGQYTLAATISNTSPPDEALCDDGVSTYEQWAVETMSVTFTVTVGGIWVSHEAPENGVLSTPEPQLEWNDGGFICYITQGGFLLPTISAVETGIVNTFGGPTEGHLRNGTVKVETGSTAKWVKIWRWEDGDGNISSCPATERTFNYAVTFEGRGRVQGDADSPFLLTEEGVATSNAVVSATILLEGDNIQHQVSPPLAKVKAEGVAKEDPASFNWKVSWSGIEIGGTFGGAESYDSGIVGDSQTYGGSAKGGDNTKTVKCTITWSGNSLSEIDNTAYKAYGAAALWVVGTVSFE